MRRFVFAAVLAALAAAAPATAYAQQPPLVAWISPGGPRSEFLDSLRQGLRERGQVEGQSYVIEARTGPIESVPELTRAIVARKPAVIVSAGPAIHAVRRAAAGVPVVFAFSGDPVEAGLVDSLAHPGGTITGMTFMSYEVNGKRLELLREAFPHIARVAILSNPMHAGEHLELRESEKAAERLGLKLRYVRVAADAHFDAAFDTIRAAGAEAVIVLPDTLVMQHRARIIAFANQQRIPTMSGWASFAHSGGVLTYGPNLDDAYRRVAAHVDKILKGAKPADLPVEQPVTLELVVNLKAAKAIGLELPQPFLARADEVIE